MRGRAIDRKQILELEQAVEKGVYVAPIKYSNGQDLLTKKLIDQMKKTNNQIASK